MLKTRKIHDGLHLVVSDFSLPTDDAKRSFVEVEAGGKTRPWEPGLKCTGVAVKSAFSDGEIRSSFIDGIPWFKSTDLDLEEWFVLDKYTPYLQTYIFKVANPEFVFVEVKGGVVSPEKVAVKRGVSAVSDFLVQS